MRVLLISGSTRAASSNTAALRTIRESSPAAIDTELYDGLDTLPAFNPDHEDDPGTAVVALRTQLSSADAVLFCTPEYAGGLPGSFKNLLDWTVGGGELYGKPVAWVNVANEGRGLGAEAALGVVLGYVGAEIVGDACAHVALGRDAIGADGLVADEASRARLAAALDALTRVG